MTSYKNSTLASNDHQDDFGSPSNSGGKKVSIHIGFSDINASFGSAARGHRDGLAWYRDDLKVATGQHRSAFSPDDVAQKSMFAGSMLRINPERT